jgi:hypothetical protein
MHTSPLLFYRIVNICIPPQGSINVKGGIWGNDSSEECLLQVGIDFEMYGPCHFLTMIFLLCQVCGRMQHRDFLSVSCCFLLALQFFKVI